MSNLTLTAEDLRGVEPFLCFYDQAEFIEKTVYFEGRFEGEMETNQPDEYLKAWAARYFREILDSFHFEIDEGVFKMNFGMEERTLTPPPGVLKAMEILGMEEITREWVES